MMWTDSNSPRVNPCAPARSLKYLDRTRNNLRLPTQSPKRLPSINTTSPHVNPWPPAPNRHSLPPINRTPPCSPPLPVNNLRLPTQSPKRLPSINTTPPHSPHVNPWPPAPNRHSLPPINRTPPCSPPLPVNNLGTAIPNRHLPGIPHTHSNTRPETCH